MFSFFGNFLLRRYVHNNHTDYLLTKGFQIWSENRLDYIDIYSAMLNPFCRVLVLLFVPVVSPDKQSQTTGFVKLQGQTALQYCDYLTGFCTDFHFWTAM